MISTQAQISLFARSVGATVRGVFRPALLVPFAVLAAVELLLLTVYLEFPALPVPAERVVALLFGNGTIHYPQHVWMIPVVLAWIRLASAVIAGTSVYPTATRRFLAFHTTPPLPQLAPGGRGVATLAVVIYAALEAATTLGVGHLADVRIIGRLQPLWIAAALFLRPLLTVTLAHTLYGIVVAGRRGAPALLSGLIVVRRRGIETFLLTAMATMVTAPLSVLIALSAVFVDAGIPGLAGKLAVVAVLCDIPIRGLLFGASVWLRTPRGVAH